MTKKFFDAKEKQTTEGLDFGAVEAWTYTSPQEDDDEAQLNVTSYTGNEYEYTGVIATAFFMALQSVQRESIK